MTYCVGMFIAEVVSKGKHGKSYTSILLRESYRVGSAVKSKTLAVLTHLRCRSDELTGLCSDKMTSRWTGM